MVKKNPDNKKYKEVTIKVIQNDGFCPCLVQKTEETKCMCKEFRDQIDNGISGFCRCGRFYNEV